MADTKLSSQIQSLFSELQEVTSGAERKPVLLPMEDTVERKSVRQVVNGLLTEDLPGATQTRRLRDRSASRTSIEPVEIFSGYTGLERDSQKPRRGTLLQRIWRHIFPSAAAAQTQESKGQIARRTVAMVILFLLGVCIGWLGAPLVRLGPLAVLARAVSSPTPYGSVETETALPPIATAATAPAAPIRTPSPIITPLLTSVASPTASPTLIPTPSSIGVVVPSPFPTLSPREYASAAAAISNALSIPTPAQPVPMAADAINILVLGSDQRPDWSAWHTDAVHVVSIQPSQGIVSVLSIPRDLYVYIPTFGMSRINFADYYGEAYNYEGGGPALMRDTLLYNLGIRMDRYVRTNFDGLIGIVDTLGGVDIPVHCRLSDYWPYPDANGEYPILTMEPGLHHMDGETALWYARSRKTTSVFSRERRQQQVLQAIWRKIRSTRTLSQIPSLWEQGQQFVTTDIGLGELAALAPLAFNLQDHSVRFYNIGPDQVTPWTTPYGGAVFLPRWENIEPLLAEMMAPVPETRLARTYSVVEVWNGTSNQNWDLLAADRVYRAGFPVVINQPDRHNYPQTQLIVYARQSKGTGVEHLQQMFGLSDSQVIYEAKESSEYGFRLIIGADYQTCDQP